MITHKIQTPLSPSLSYLRPITSEKERKKEKKIKETRAGSSTIISICQNKSHNLSWSKLHAHTHKFEPRCDLSLPRKTKKLIKEFHYEINWLKITQKC